MTVATVPLISVEEYLHMTYRPDCDYIDGVVVERNLGQYSHSTLQMLTLMTLQERAEQWGILVRPELRVKIRNGKYRVPDVVVLSKDAPRPPVIEQPPLLCIEIVSPDDRLRDLTERAQDYLVMGVPETWIVDPETKTAYRYSTAGLHEIPSGTVMQHGQIQLNPFKLFAQL